MILTIPTAQAEKIKIALTFDDGPMPDSAIMTGNERTVKIIAALKNNNVADALFFIKANNISPATEKRLGLYTDAGYHLANHSFSHGSANELAVDDFLVDAYRAHLTLKKYDNVIPYFRMPYLHYGKDLGSINSLQAGLAELGYKDGFVTIDNYDWYINSLINNASEQGKKINYKKAEALYVKSMYEAILFYDDIARQAKLNSRKHILLLHENDTSALFLDALIKKIKKHGGVIISPQEVYEEADYQDFPQTVFQKQGRIAALAHGSGVSESKLKHKAESTEYLDELFKQHKVFQ